MYVVAYGYDFDVFLYRMKFLLFPDYIRQSKHGAPNDRREINVDPISNWQFVTGSDSFLK